MRCIYALQVPNTPIILLTEALAKTLKRVPSKVSSEVTLGEKEILFKIPFAPPTPDESSVIRKRYERRGRGFGALLIWLVIIMIGSLIINAFKALFRKKK